MILSGEDIHKVLADGRIVIEPAPSREDIDTTSIDLRMGAPLWVWKEELHPSGNGPPTVPADGFDYRAFCEDQLEEVPLGANGAYRIEPRCVYLGSTFEKVSFPAGSRLAGRVEGKSTLARLGLMVHMTAPMIHCGTGLGIITLEMYNFGPFAIEVVPERTRICQLVLEEVSRDPGERTGRQFTGQKNAKG